MSSIIYHSHHILPKHMGGTDDPSNLVKLTVEEHANAHKKLWEEHGHWQDEIAYKGLLGILSCDEVKLNAGKLANLGNKNALGKKWSDESKCKMIGNKNGLGHKYVCSEETKQKIRLARAKQVSPKGFKLSEETKKKISESVSKKQLGVKRGTYKKTIKT
jgi:hypothetical protein